jgi:hypothetical protein
MHQSGMPMSGTQTQRLLQPLLQNNWRKQPLQVWTSRVQRTTGKNNKPAIVPQHP